MSEMAAEPRPAAKHDNVFTRKLGPLPMWAWVAIVSAVLIGYFYLKNKQSAQTATPSGTNASQIPQFVNQVFTSVQPPGTPPPDVDRDKDKRPPPPVRWVDERGKSKQIRNWEHHHPGQEYPFNTWQGNPTAAEIAAFNASPGTVPPTMPQGNSWPVNPPVGAGGGGQWPVDKIPPFSTSPGPGGGGGGMLPNVAALPLQAVGVTSWQQAAANTPPPTSGPPQQMGGGSIGGKRFF